MTSILRYSAVAALVSRAAGAVIGAMPSQTVGGGFGAPIFALPLPTEAPSLELVKRKLEKKGVTNICTEWTIPGGGQPECGDFETCLFTSADGYYYEGCGETSVSYNWITECWNYPQYGIAPISQIFCPEDAPYCGFYAFIFGVDYTFWNFGCSTVPYSLYVDLLPTTTGEASSPVVLAGGGTTSITPVASTIYVTQQPSTAGATSSILLPPGATQSANSAPTSTSSPGGSSSLPIIGSHSTSSTPTGAIVGGVIGGIALIAFLAFLLWFFLRKRKQDQVLSQTAAQNQQQQADNATAVAFNNNNRISEMGGVSKPAAAYIAPPSPGVYPEKQTMDGKATEVYRPQGQSDQSAYVDNAHPGPQSPPPIYSQPQHPSPSIPSPPSNYNELEEQRRMGSGSPVSLPLSQAGQLSPDLRQRQDVSELGGTNRGSWNVPPGVQEMGGSTGGVTRRPVGGAGQSADQWVDMSGAPMSEEFHSNELE